MFSQTQTSLIIGIVNATWRDCDGEFDKINRDTHFREKKYPIIFCRL